MKSYSGVSLTPSQLILCTAIFLVATGNHAFFAATTEIYPWAEHGAFLISVAFVLAGALALIMIVASLLLPVRSAAAAMLLLGAVVGYFADQYGVVIDAGMLRNTLETDVAEARDLLSGGLMLRFILLGAVPAGLLYAIPLRPASRRNEALRRAGFAGLVLSVMLLCLVAFSGQYSGFFRQHKPLRYYTNPAYALYSAGQLLAGPAVAGPQGPPAQIGIAAHVPATDESHDLIIMVVGETARRDRFSLNGYRRDTNPLLKNETRLVSYTEITACGTSTKESVPCMFSLLSHAEFSNDKAAATENVLDVLARAGVSVLWRDNNSSSKGVADRVTFEDYKSGERNPVCDLECRDVGMLQDLQAYIDAQDGDVLIVLHQMGNHGPAYFKRYPPDFEQFTPACHSEELAACTDAEISNAYDNAILYTDYFLHEVINLLKANTARYETTMLYVSDHGESLGEKGLYLHGMPYAFAPAEQTAVPVLVWAGMTSDVDIASARALKDVPNSHDAVFQSLLMLFEVESELQVEGPVLFELVDD